VTVALTVVTVLPFTMLFELVVEDSCSKWCHPSVETWLARDAGAV